HRCFATYDQGIRDWRLGIGGSDAQSLIPNPQSPFRRTAELLVRGSALPNQSYGVTLLMRVPQLARLLRVPPQLPNGALTYWAKVQVCPMYSEAIQIELPSITAAP